MNGRLSAVACARARSACGTGLPEGGDGLGWCGDRGCTCGVARPTWGGVRESVLDSSSGLANARRVTANSPVGTAGLTLGGILPTEALMVDARKCGGPGHREAVAGKALDESSPAPAAATIAMGDLDRRGPVAKDARHVAQTTYDRPAGASPGRPVGTSPRPALGRARAALETTRRGGGAGTGLPGWTEPDMSWARTGAALETRRSAARTTRRRATGYGPALLGGGRPASGSDNPRSVRSIPPGRLVGTTQRRPVGTTPGVGAGTGRPRWG
jgi:hypothetical protein